MEHENTSNPTDDTLSLRELRERAGLSRAKAAAAADVTETTAKIFEVAGPEGICNPGKRASLIAVYEDFRKRLAEAA